MTRTRRMLATVLLAVLTSAGTVPPAAAHTELVEASPAAGSAEAGAVTRVRLGFSAALGAGFAQVLVRGNGRSWSVGPVTVRGGVVTAEVGPIDRAGSYQVAYRVVAVDGHPVTGVVPFTVTAESASAARAVLVSGADPGLAEVAEVAEPMVGPTRSGRPWDRLPSLLGVATILALVALSRVRRSTEPSGGES